MQIFEGTNQIQRLVISRGLTPPPSRGARDDVDLGSGQRRPAR
jgi:hypothetical protein